MLKNLISSKTKRKLLTLFLTNPTSQFYVRELSRLLGEPLNAIRREIKKLYDLGLLLFQKRGNMLYYSINRSCAIYPEIKRIILKTEGLGEFLAGSIGNIKTIDFAFIYGSVAIDREEVVSDLDLMIIGSIKSPDLHKIVSKIEKRIFREINYTLITPAEYRKRCIQKDPFLSRVLLGKKIMVKGREDALLRTFKEGVD